MNNRLSLATVAAGTTAVALVLTACSSGSSDSNDPLGTGAVTGANAAAPSTTVTTTPASPTSTASSPTAASSPTGSFADRAGIPPRRYIDAGAETEIPDQSGDGTVVRITEARLSRGSGHIAIFTRAGRLLGSAPVSQASSPATVKLSTRVPATGELQAVLFTDDGDGRFDITKDRAINDGDTDADDRLDLEGEDFDYVLR